MQSASLLTTRRPLLLAIAGAALASAKVRNGMYNPDIATAGLDLMVYDHEAEIRKNAREWRYLLAYTEPKLVSFGLDGDWVFRDGPSPVSLIDGAGFLLRALNLSNPRNGQDLELFRDGDIHLAPIAGRPAGNRTDARRDTSRQYALATQPSLSRGYAQEMFGSRPGSRPLDMGPHVHPHS
jgi:hypothetical protein